MATHPESVGLPGKPPANEDFSGMPVYHRDMHVGNLYLTEKEGGQEFTQEDEDIASMFAAQAALAIASFQRYEEAQQARMEMETLMDISPVAVSVFDARVGQITYLNQESRRILGTLELSDDQLESSYELLTFSRTDGRELQFADLPGTKALQTGETVRAEEVVIHRPDGTSLTTLVNCAPLFSESGEISSILSVMQDMTPLEDVERQKGEFLGMVSEELRTPVATIKGSAAALKSIVEPMGSNELTQMLRIIDQQADLMRSQLNSLIELTQIDSGTLSVAAESTNVAALLERSCRDYLRDHAAITIQLDVLEDLPDVMADRQRISQVLHNFLRQAAKHSSESSPVKVSASMKDIYVAISVSVVKSTASLEELSSSFKSTDPSRLLERLTMAHHRAADVTSQGEGLALAYCRGVVEAHGGLTRTDLDEQEGTFTMTFTLQAVEEEHEILHPDIQEVEVAPLPAPSEKTRILVSTEDTKLLAAVRKVLFNAGYGAVATTALDEVYDLASSERAKLVILDIAGREEECFDTLRRAGPSLNLPAIVLCDRDDEEYVVRAYEMGADGYMVKPFSPSELIARIKATLRRLTTDGGDSGSKTFQTGEVLINFDERTVRVSGQAVQFTATEYKLLTELANSAGKVLFQDTLLHRVWGPEYSGESQLLRSYIKSLRQKLGDNARKPMYIFTEHGVGYRMAKASSADDGQAILSPDPRGIGIASRARNPVLSSNGIRSRHIVKQRDFINR